MQPVDVLDVLPQKPPFLFVDKIVEVVPGEMAVGIKVLGINEPYFAGHFPGKPIMPGVLQIEAINQVGEVALLMDPRFKGKLAYVTGCNNARFKKPAVPGDVLVITTYVLDCESKVGRGKGKIEVDGKIICETDLTFYIEK